MIVVVVIFLSLVAVAMTVGYGLNWLWLRGAVAKPSAKPSATMPACGGCGYPARGITSFECPECGADLREVGIKRPWEIQFSPSRVIIPLTYSVIFLLIAVFVAEFVEKHRPQNHVNYSSINLQPVSRAFAMVQFKIETKQTSQLPVPYRGMYPSGSGTNLSIVLPQFSFNTKSTAIVLTLYPNQPLGNSPDLVLEMNPLSQHAVWNDHNNQTYSSQGPLTQQELVSFFTSAGVTNSSPAFTNEVADLYQLLLSASNGSSSIAISSFTHNGFSSGSSTRNAYQWIEPVYHGVLLLLWAGGLALIVKGGKRQKPRPKQNQKKY